MGRPKNITLTGGALVQALDRQEQWFQNLTDDCRSLIVEARTASTWTIICAYHAIGSAINSYKEEFDSKGMNALQIADKVGMAMKVSRCYIYDAMRFASKFPDLERFPGDKSMTWSRVRCEYLIEKGVRGGSGKRTCPQCGHKF